MNQIECNRFVSREKKKEKNTVHPLHLSAFTGRTQPKPNLAADSAGFMELLCNLFVEWLEQEKASERFKQS